MPFLLSLTVSLLLLLPLLALSLPAIRPWLRGELVCSDDILLHLLRAAQLEALLRKSVLYSRWAPNMAFGYGAPFYNFYAPLSYYIVALLALGLGRSLLAFFIAFALAPVAAALAMYLLARRHFSPRSALVAAVAYIYAPYMGYDAFFRGNLAETWAWVFPPLALLAMGNLARTGTRRHLALAAIALAPLLLTHNVLALLFTPLIAAYGLMTALVLSPPPLRARHAAVVLGAVLLGMGLAAFFWLPALAERDLVHSHRLLVPPVFVYWGNFIGWRELLAIPPVLRPDLLNPSPHRGLGLVHILLALPGFLGLILFRDRVRRLQVAFFGAALLFCAWMTSASSRLVWDHLPLIQYVQFPWRFLAPAALSLAMMAAAAADILNGAPIPSSRPYWSAAPVAVAILALVLGSLFWFDPRYCPWWAAFPDASSIPAFERQTNLIATTAKGEYVPRWVNRMPEEDAVAPLDPDTLPAGTNVACARSLPVGAELLITATQPFTAVYNTFYYPGWRVQIDGRSVPVVPESDYGRITFAVPEGAHRISIRFGETPLRQAADILSVLSLLLTVGLLVARSSPHRHPGDHVPLIPSPFWTLWGLVLFGLVLGIYHWENPLRHPRLRDGHLLGLAIEWNVPFEGGPTFLGLDSFPTTVPADGRIRMDLYWTAWKKPERRYHHSVLVLDSGGTRWNTDPLPPREFRDPPDTWLWYPGTYAHKAHTIELLPGTPPGVYTLTLVLFDRETLVPQRALIGGLYGPPSLSLGPLTVTRPLRFPNPDDVPVGHRVNARLGPFTLVGMDVQATEASPGDKFSVTFYWLAEETPGQDLLVRLALIGAEGAVAAKWDLPPTSATHLTTNWQAGDFWRGQPSFHLPARLNDGDYHWQVVLLDRKTGRETSPILTLPISLHVTSPIRVFAPPPVAYSVGVPLREGMGDTHRDLATLMGFDLRPETVRPGETLTVTLVWRAEAETSASYKVFLHLRAVNDAVIVQSDGVPAGWTRPTTGWLPGEYIADERILALPPDLPPGLYTLVAGLYLPDGPRLTTPDGQNEIRLTDITVGP